MGASNPQKTEMVIKNLQTFIPKVRALRAYGSAGINLCYLAMGSVDAYFEFGFHIWDYAAPLLLVTETDQQVEKLLISLRHQVVVGALLAVKEVGGILIHF